MPKYFLILLALLFVAGAIEVEISVPGFPEMAQYFNVTESVIQLTIALNFLGYSIAAFFYGPLSDIYGRRFIMIIGNAILMIGALGTAFSNDIQTLLIFRFIQGFGASTSAVVAPAMILDYHKGPEAAASVGIINAILSILIASAPIIGGFVNLAVGWQGNYMIVAAISVISWIVLLVFLPETTNDTHPMRLKETFKGYVQMFTHRIFLISSIAPTMPYAAYLAFIASAPFLYRDSLGLSVTAYSLHQALIIGAFCLTSFFSGRLSRLLGVRRCVLWGEIITIIGALLFVIESLFVLISPARITASMALFTIGFALSYPLIYSFSLDIFPKVKGTASSAVIGSRALLVALYVALTSFFFNGEALNLAIMVFLAAFVSFILFLEIFKDHHFIKSYMRDEKL